MRMTRRSGMAKTNESDPVFAGTGGVVLGEARTNHEGRKAILLVRDNENTAEFVALVATMGITIVETLHQAGQPDPRGYFGKGRLQDVADELSSRIGAHPWQGVDLVLLHTNASPRQLVGVSEGVQIEVWDRVRLLLSLFTSHASSLEARTQVRIARMQSDRTVLRELANQQTTGERAGYGGGGITALQATIANINRELVHLRKRQKKHAVAQSERRKQRSRGGAMTVGLAGYTNAGKSSLFLALSGKEVLVKDKLFSTLETTIGRMEASPRVLLADTIGFIDHLPSSTLDAFRATLAEALESDLLLILADASDKPEELERKLFTSRNEVFTRFYGEEIDEEFPWNSSDTSVVNHVLTVLTKIDQASDAQLEEAVATVAALGLPDPILISSHSGEGMQKLKDSILWHLFGPPTDLLLLPVPAEGGRAVEGLISDVYDSGLVSNRINHADGIVEMRVWIHEHALARLLAHSKHRIEVK
ncbi:MAG: HflX family GTPase [Candidatus Poseidoniales archaeon]|nr:MAG: HflX family GTPase [Candidatus Poseidoniales archaeon]